MKTQIIFHVKDLLTVDNNIKNLILAQKTNDPFYPKLASRNRYFPESDIVNKIKSFKQLENVVLIDVEIMPPMEITCKLKNFFGFSFTNDLTNFIFRAEHIYVTNNRFPSLLHVPSHFDHLYFYLRDS